MIKYSLSINGVLIDFLKRLKDIDEYLYSLGIDNNHNYYISVKKEHL